MPCERRTRRAPADGYIFWKITLVLNVIEYVDPVCTPFTRNGAGWSQVPSQVENHAPNFIVGKGFIERWHVCINRFATVVNGPVEIRVICHHGHTTQMPEVCRLWTEYLGGRPVSTTFFAVTASTILCVDPLTFRQRRISGA